MRNGHRWTGWVGRILVGKVADTRDIRPQVKVCCKHREAAVESPGPREASLWAFPLWVIIFRHLLLSSLAFY